MKRIVLLSFAIITFSLSAAENLEYLSSEENDDEQVSRDYAVILESDIMDEEIEEIRELSDRLGATILFENLVQLGKKGKKSFVIRSNQKPKTIKIEFMAYNGVKSVSFCNKPSQ